MPASPTLQESLDQGQEALNANELGAAQAAFQQALKTDSSSVDAYNGLAQVSYQQGKLDDAEMLFEEAYEIALEEFDGEMPKTAPWKKPANRPLLKALHGIGMVAFRRNDREKTHDCFTRLMQLNPTDEQGAHFFLGALKAGKKWSEMG